MPLIQVSVNQNQIEISPARLEKAAERILSALGCTEETELSILVVDDEEMHRLNLEYRQVDSTTDVLSFPMQEGEFGNICPELLGDVVLSAPTAQLMAHEHGCSLSSVLDLLLVHGILHLLGYDHEWEPEEAQEMHRKTREVLSGLGHAREAFDWFFGEEAKE